MTPRERTLARLLAETLSLCKRVERCPVCIGPSSALEGKHEKEWNRLRARIERALSTLPN